MTRLRTVASVLALLASAAALSAQSSPLQEGVNLIREGQFDQALVKLEAAHRLAPSNPAIENFIGIAETQLGHIDEACNHYRNAIRLDPSQTAPHRNLGFNLLTAKDYGGAEPELREALRLNPNDDFAHYYMSLLALATSRDAEAIEQASHAGQLSGKDPEVGAGLVEAYVRIGSVDDASKRIEQLEKANQLPSAREFQIAVLLSRRAYYSQAVHCFRRIASLDPSWQSRYNLSLALLFGGQPVEASTLLTTLLSEQPNNADMLTFLGSAFELQQKMPEALEAYRAAAASDPSNPDRTLDYTRLLMDLDRYDEAIQVVHDGMEATSATGPLELRLGAVEMLKSNYTSARDAFHAALASDPELDAAYVGLAQTYSREANDSEAIRILEDARGKPPGHYPLEYYFGLLASRLGREAEAATALEKAAALEPNSPNPFYELGKLHVAQQEWPQARKAFEHVIALNSQFAPAHYQLSRVYARLGLNAKAEREAKQTHMLVDTQRDEALRRQRERAGSFQPQASANQLLHP